MSAITRTGFVALILFLFPCVAQAVVVSPQNIDLQVEPGEKISFELVVTNDSTKTLEYEVQFYSVELGGGPGDLSFFDLTDSIVVRALRETPEIILEAGQNQKIFYELAVTSGVNPGTKVVAAQIFEKPSEGNGVVVASGRISLVFLSVGELQELVEVVDFSSSVSRTSHLPIEFYSVFRNDGESVAQPSGIIKISNIFGKRVEALPINEEYKRITPGSERTVLTTWGNGEAAKSGFIRELRQEFSQFHFGIYSVVLDTNISNIDSSSVAPIRVVLLPWRTIIVFFGILLVLGVTVFVTRKK